MPGFYLDTDFSFNGTVPDDLTTEGITGRQTGFYQPYDAREQETNQLLDNNALLKYILRNSDIDILLKTIGNAFFPQGITIGTAPTLINAPNRSPRGYKLINPNTTVSGVVTAVTAFPAGTVFPIGTTNSAAINVSGHGGAAFIMDISAATVGTMRVDLQTQDPISGNWTTVQSDLYSGAAAVGTYYANVGAIGIDQFARLAVVVAGATITGSIAAMLKPQLAGTVAGPTVFLGGPDVNTTVGMPLLSGDTLTYYLKENTPIYGVAVAATDVRLFSLQ